MNIQTGPLKWRPQCYMVHPKFIVCEDLSLAGYKHYRDIQFFEAPQIKCCLEAVARMHASSMAYELCQLNGRSFVDEFQLNLPESSFIKENTWFQVGLNVSGRGEIGIRKKSLKYFFYIAHCHPGSVSRKL